MEAVRKGVSKSETARRFGVDRSMVRRYLRHLEEVGTLSPKKAPGSSPKLDESAMRLLEEDLKARPWATHGQRSEFQYVACGVKVSEATIERCLGSKPKKITGSEREGRVTKAGVASDHRHT